MAKMDKTGMILAGGAIGLGLLLLPGFFRGRPGEESEKDPNFVPDELPPADLDTSTEDGKPVLIAKNLPKLIVGTGQTSYAALSGMRNRGVGSHMKAGTVDVWRAAYVDVMAEWDIQNPSAAALPLDFRVTLRLTRDFTTKSLFLGRGWGETFGRDETHFEYTPKDGIKTDRFFDAFHQGVKTTHGATRGSRPTSLMIPAGSTRTFLMGVHLPGPGYSKDLSEFWEASPQFNFRIEPHQGNRKFAEHEFKDAFTTSVVRPELIALPSTGNADSPRLTIRGRN